MRRFYLNRKVDISGVSGTGRVAEGTQYSNGWCTIVWLSEYRSGAFYESIATVEAIHGHGGATYIEWIDAE